MPARTTRLPARDMTGVMVAITNTPTTHLHSRIQTAIIKTTIIKPAITTLGPFSCYLQFLQTPLTILHLLPTILLQLAISVFIHVLCL